MPFGGRHPDSSAMLAEDVPRRLKRNRKLHRELTAGFIKVTVREGDDLVETVAVPFDSDKYRQLFAHIARGLSAFHWGVGIPATHKVEAVILNPFYEAAFRKLFLQRAKQRINGRIGGGAFLYQGMQGIDDPALTMWRFKALGGIDGG